MTTHVGLFSAMAVAVVLETCSHVQALCPVDRAFFLRDDGFFRFVSAMAVAAVPGGGVRAAPLLAILPRQLRGAADRSPDEGHEPETGQFLGRAARL